MANATSPLYNHLTTVAAVYEQNGSTATESLPIAMRVLCYNMRMCVKEVTMLFYGWAMEVRY